VSDFQIREQVKLSARRCAALVLDGIRFRLFRASVTVAVVGLAVAFLMAILGDSLIGRQVEGAVRELTGPRRSVLFWTSRLSSPLSEQDLAVTLARGKEGGARRREFTRWGKCSEEELAEPAGVARRELACLEFFENLGEGKLRPLVGRARGREIFSALVDDDAFAGFLEALGNTGLQMPLSRDEFREFLRDRERTEALRRRIVEGHGRALAAAGEFLGGRTALEALSEIDEPARQRLNELGFVVTAEEADMLRNEARNTLDIMRLTRLLGNTQLKQRFAIRYGIKAEDVNANALFEAAGSDSGARWLLETQAETGEPLEMTAERVREVAQTQVARNKIARMESAIESSAGKKVWLGFSSRVLWLTAVSMLVCAVGIANAMLMSVTERFVEIATMKCLGATDGFIMTNFIFESGFQGLAGGVVGAVIGLLLGLLRSSLNYGLQAWMNLPFGALASAMGISIVAGVTLSVIAAVYPARVAAKLAPMEAMRVE